MVTFGIARPSQNRKINQRNTRREVILFGYRTKCTRPYIRNYLSRSDGTKIRITKDVWSRCLELGQCPFSIPSDPLEARIYASFLKKKLTQRFKSLISFNMTNSSVVHVKYRVTWKCLISFMKSRTWSDEMTPLVVISDLEASSKLIAHTTWNWWSSRALLSSVYLRRTVSWLLSQITQINYDISSNAITPWNRVINTRHSSACHIVRKDVRCQTSVVNAKSLQ